MFGIYARNIVAKQGRYFSCEEREAIKEEAMESEKDVEEFFNLLKDSSNRQKIIDEASKRFPNKPKYEIEQAYEKAVKRIKEKEHG